MTSHKIEDTKVGNDVEFFLINSKGVITPSWDLGMGTKDSPLKVNGGFISEDGVSAEVSPAPASSEQEFVENLTTVMDELAKFVKPHGLSLVTKASVKLPDNVLKKSRSRVVGCDEDYDPWGRNISVNATPTYNRKIFRCSGGHVHVSHPILRSNEWKRVAAKLFDMYLGVPAVLMDRDANRRSMYGKPGAHRPTSYPDGSCGVEYRVLSNFWTKSDNMTRWVYQQTIRLVEDLIVREKEGDYEVLHEDMITYCIREGDREQAQSALNYFPIEMPARGD